jgi:RHH-type rel operon transcriptional repressor/antitoxin RelB
MQLSLPANVEAKLSELAALTGRTAGELVRELVEAYVAHDEWFQTEVRKGLAEAQAGEMIDHEEVAQRMESRFREKQSR